MVPPLWFTRPETVKFSPASVAMAPPYCFSSPVIASVPVPFFVSTAPPSFTIRSAVMLSAFTSPVTSMLLPPAMASALIRPATVLPSAASVSVFASI